MTPVTGHARHNRRLLPMGSPLSATTCRCCSSHSPAHLVPSARAYNTAIIRRNPA